MKNFIKEITSNKHVDNRLDYVFNRLDNLLISKKYDDCNSLLKIDVENIDLSVLIGILTITLMFKNKLPERLILYNKIEKLIFSKYSEKESKEILIGLK